MMHVTGTLRVVALVFVWMLSAAACSSDSGAEQDKTPSTPLATELDDQSGSSASPPIVTEANPTVTSTDSSTTPTTSTESSVSSETDWVLEDQRLAVPNQPTRYVIGLYGDSLFDSAREHVLFSLDTGARMDIRDSGIFSGSSLCTFLPLMEDDIENANLWGVIIWFSGNTLAECSFVDGERTLDPERIIADMEAHLMQLGDRYQERGIRVWMPNFPLSRAGAFNGESMAPALNAMVARIASAFDVVEAVDVAASVLDENGGYTETLPCLPIEPCLLVDDDGNGVNFVREPDGTHFCTGSFKGAGLEDARWGTCPTYSSGSLRIAMAMTKPVIEAAYRDWAAEPASRFPPVTLPSFGN